MVLEASPKCAAARPCQEREARLARSPYAQNVARLFDALALITVANVRLAFVGANGPNGVSDSFTEIKASGIDQLPVDLTGGHVILLRELDERTTSQHPCNPLEGIEEFCWRALDEVFAGWAFGRKHTLSTAVRLI